MYEKQLPLLLIFYVSIQDHWIPRSSILNLSKSLSLAPICELVVLYRISSSTLQKRLISSLLQIIFKLLMYVLSHGCLLNSYKAFFNFAHMILPIMCLNFQWLQMSLRSLCLLSVRILVLGIFPCIPRCFHLLDDGTFRYCILDIILHFGLFLELSPLVLRNKSHPSFVVGDCMRSFLQVKCTSCMVRNIS